MVAAVDAVWADTCVCICFVRVFVLALFGALGVRVPD